MIFTVIQQFLVGTADRGVVPHMIDAGAGSGRKLLDIFDLFGLFDRQKGCGRFREASFSDTAQGDDDAGLKEDGKLLLKGIRKAFFRGNADFL